MSTIIPSTSNYRIKEGYLVKRGHIVKSWKRRFFVLDNTILTYYSNAGDNKSKGSINLAYAKIITAPTPIVLPSGITNKSSITTNISRLWSSSSSSSSSSITSTTTSTNSSTSSADTNTSNTSTSNTNTTNTNNQNIPKGYSFTIIENGLLTPSNANNTPVVSEEWGLVGSNKRSGRITTNTTGTSNNNSTTPSTVTEYILCTENETERQIWIDSIQYNIQLYQSTIPKNSNLSQSSTTITNTVPYNNTDNTKDTEKVNILNNDTLQHSTDTSSLLASNNENTTTILSSVSNNNQNTLSITSTSDISNSHPIASISSSTDLPSSLYIFTGTWNMAEEPPPKTIQDWIPKDADVYAISLQECMHTDAVLMAIHRHIGSSYIEIHHRIGATMKGLGFHGHIVLAVYVRDWMVTRGICRLSKAVRGSVALGRNLYLTRAANKGAVAISLPIRLPDNTGALTVTSALVFLSCHLTSDSKGKNKVDKRNRDARKMLDSLGLTLTTTAIDRARSQLLAAKLNTTDSTTKSTTNDKNNNKENINNESNTSTSDDKPQVPQPVSGGRAARVAALRNQSNEVNLPISAPSSATDISTSSTTETKNNAPTIVINNSNISTDSANVEAIADLLGIDEDEDDEEGMNDDAEEEPVIGKSNSNEQYSDANGSDNDALSDISESERMNKYANLDIDSEEENNTRTLEPNNNSSLSRQTSVEFTVSSASEQDELLPKQDNNNPTNSTTTSTNVSSTVPTSVNSPTNNNNNNRKRGYSFWQTGLDLLSPALSRKASTVSNSNEYDKLLDGILDNEKSINNNNNKGNSPSTTPSSKKGSIERQQSALQASPGTPMTVPTTNDNPLGIIPGRAYVMVAGDLNYRLQKISCEDTLLAIAQAGEKDIALRKQFTELSSLSSLSNNSLTKLNCESPWQTLLDADQMRQELNKNFNLLPGFVEAPISFPPTYRRKKGEISTFLRSQGDHKDVNKVREAFATVVRKTANGEVVSAVNTDTPNPNNSNESDPLLSPSDETNVASTNAVQPKKSELRVPSYTDRVLIRNPLLAGVPISVDTFNQQRNKRKSRRLSKRLNAATTMNNDITNTLIATVSDNIDQPSDSVDSSPVRSITKDSVDSVSTPTPTFVPLPPLRCIYYDVCDTVSVSDHTPVASLWELPFTNSLTGNTNINKSTIPYGPIHLDKLSAIHHHNHHHNDTSVTTHGNHHKAFDSTYEYNCIPPFPIEIASPITIIDQHKDSQINNTIKQDNSNTDDNTTLDNNLDNNEKMKTNDDKKDKSKTTGGNTKITKDKYNSNNNNNNSSKDDDYITYDTDGLDPLPITILQSLLTLSSSTTNSKLSSATDSYVNSIVSLLPPTDPLFNNQRRATIAYANIHGPVVLERLLNELSRYHNKAKDDTHATNDSSRIILDSTAETIFQKITNEASFPFYKYDKDNNNTEAINDYLLQLGLVPPPLSLLNSNTGINTGIPASSVISNKGNNKTGPNNNITVPPPSLATLPLNIIPSHVREFIVKSIDHPSELKNIRVENSVDVPLVTSNTNIITIEKKENIPSDIKTPVKASTPEKEIPSTILPGSDSSVKPTIQYENNESKVSSVVPARAPSESFSNARNMWQARTNKQ